MINNTRWNRFRNTLFVSIANFVLRGAQKEYRQFVEGAIYYGLVEAERNRHPLYIVSESGTDLIAGDSEKR